MNYWRFVSAESADSEKYVCKTTIFLLRYNVCIKVVKRCKLVKKSNDIRHIFATYFCMELSLLGCSEVFVKKYTDSSYKPLPQFNDDTVHFCTCVTYMSRGPICYSVLRRRQH